MSPRGPDLFPRRVDPEGPASEPIDWIRVRAAVLRFRWLAAGVVATSLVAGIVASRLVKPKYLAQASVWIDERDRQDAAAKPFQPGRLLDPEAWVDLLQSYVVLDSVVKDQRLYLQLPASVPSDLAVGFDVTSQFRPGTYVLAGDPTGRTYALTTGDGIELDRVPVGDSLGLRQGFRWAPSPGLLTGRAAVRFTVLTPRDAARALSQQLQVAIDQQGNILRVALEGTDPRRAADVLNAITGRFVAVAAGLEHEKLTEVTKILGDQLQSAAQDLAVAENGLTAFGERTITLPGEAIGASVPATGTAAAPSAPADPELNRYFELESEREQLHADRAALLQAVATVGDSGIAVEALNMIPAVQRSKPLSQALTDLSVKQGDLRALRYRYSDAYPAVQQLMGDVATLERRTIPDLARALATQLAAREGELAGQASSSSATLRAVPARTMEDARLRRAVGLAEQTYAQLKQRYDEARLVDVSTVPGVRILDTAIPPDRPVKDVALRIIALAVGGGVVLAVVLAVLLDRADPKLRYPAQVSRGMGLSILGAIPHLHGVRHRGPQQPADVAGVVEALRAVRFGLEYACADMAPMTLAISSPGSGDGKSFLTANLGLAFAEARKRTLVIDADLRRGLLHRRFGLDRRPGLSDFLSGTAPLDKLLRPTRYPYLDLIPCGTRAQVAPELLGGTAMAELMHQLRARYDVIICDTPPLTAGIDPYVVAVLTGRLVVVLRTGVSHLALTEAKLEALQQTPVRLVGAVLNDVPEGSAYGYYSYYLPGYEAVNEEDPPRPRTALPV
ncbi:MAG: polysaccharide biosynthesis tyrosine autokinase [Gemmatimonadales bacterium]